MIFPVKIVSSFAILAFMCGHSHLLVSAKGKFQVFLLYCCLMWEFSLFARILGFVLIGLGTLYFAEDTNTTPIRVNFLWVTNIIMKLTVNDRVSLIGDAFNNNAQ